jgi:hypothetical protein
MYIYIMRIYRYQRMIKMDPGYARSIWDRYVNQDPRDFIEFSEFFKAYENGQMSRNDAITQDVNEYLGQLDEMFPGEDISIEDFHQLREAMRTILYIVYESA